MTTPRKSPTSGKRKLVPRVLKIGRTVDAKTGRVVLFPTEPSRLGRKRIEEAVDRVTSKK